MESRHLEKQPKRLASPRVASRRRVLDPDWLTPRDTPLATHDRNSTLILDTTTRFDGILCQVWTSFSQWCGRSEIWKKKKECFTKIEPSCVSLWNFKALSWEGAPLSPLKQGDAKAKHYAAPSPRVALCRRATSSLVYAHVASLRYRSAYFGNGRWNTREWRAGECHLADLCARFAVGGFGGAFTLL